MKMALGAACVPDLGQSQSGKRSDMLRQGMMSAADSRVTMDAIAGCIVPDCDSGRL
jgi:hypothetical protein